MQLPDKKNNSSDTNRIALLSIFLAYILIIGVIERSIPFDFFVPGVKLGLANCIVLTALYLFPFSQVMALVVLKCVMTAFFTGNFVSFLYSLSGSLLSFFIMYLLVHFLAEKISSIGISVAGAIFHNIGQILIASVVMGSLLIVTYLPALLISGVITGILIGVSVKYILIYIRKQHRQIEWNR